MQDVQGGKGLVALADELRVHVGKVRFQRGIVLRGGQIGNVLTSGVQLFADRRKDIPVALIVRKNRKRSRLLPLGLAAGRAEAELHPKGTHGVDACAEHAQKDGKEHASCAGINIEIVQHFAASFVFSEIGPTAAVLDVAVYGKPLV